MGLIEIGLELGVGQGIALAFLPPSVEIGDTVQIDVRGEAVDAQVVKPPFVKASPTEPVG